MQVNNAERYKKCRNSNINLGEKGLDFKQLETVVEQEHRNNQFIKPKTINQHKQAAFYELKDALMNIILKSSGDIWLKAFLSTICGVLLRA